MFNKLLSIWTVSVLPVLTGGAWVGGKTAQTIINEQQGIEKSINEGKDKLISYAVLGAVIYFGYKYYMRRK